MLMEVVFFAMSCVENDLKAHSLKPYLAEVAFTSLFCLTREFKNSEVFKNYWTACSLDYCLKIVYL